MPSQIVKLVESSCVAASTGMGKTGASAAGYVDFSPATSTFWEKSLAGEDGRLRWYGKAEEWWANAETCPPTVDGVLGGFGNLDGVDIADSTKFLRRLFEGPAAAAAAEGGGAGGACAAADRRPPLGRGRALDGGAGIGRVTKHLLSNFFERVDLLEGNQRLLDSVLSFCTGPCAERLGELHCSRLQDFTPLPGRYNCIWIQWVVIYLTDVDFVAFLRRCATGLTPDGLIVIKDNVLQETDPDDFILDDADSSLTRSPAYMEHIFGQAGLSIVLREWQADFPSNMYPVLMYALRPAATAAAAAAAAAGGSPDTEPA